MLEEESERTALVVPLRSLTIIVNTQKGPTDQTVVVLSKKGQKEVNLDLIYIKIILLLWKSGVSVILCTFCLYAVYFRQIWQKDVFLNITDAHI